MPQRRVFGAKSRAKHDAFGAMLFSSPEVSRTQKMSDASPVITKEPATKSVAKPTALQEIDANGVCQAQRIPISAKIRPKHQTANTAARSRPERALDSPKPLARKDSQETRPTLYYDEGKQVRRPKGLDFSKREKPIDGEKHHQRADESTGEETQLEKIDEDVYSPHCAPLLKICEKNILPFDSWIERMQEHLEMEKIAEASFGEVFRLSMRCEETRADRLENSVLKIIPLTPPDATLPRTKRGREARLKRTAMMSKPEDVASEVRLLQRMSSVPGFTNFRDVQILKGRPSGMVIGAYKCYNKRQKLNDKETSHFTNPALKSSYSEDQLWAVIEMEDAGIDLERLYEHTSCSIWYLWDIFWRTTLALAKGEESAEFEHRDLHLGNICVQALEMDDSSCKLDQRLGFTNVEVTLIDYTISRAKLSGECEQPEIAYLDLAQDQHLFTADSSYEYQYEIYRYMRSALFHDSAVADFSPMQSRSNTRDWSQFHPQTNIVWLHYVLHMLMAKLQRPSSAKAPTRNDGKLQISVHKKAVELEHILTKLQQELDPGVIIKNGLASAGSLVTLALSNNWLRPEDVVGEEVSTVEHELADIVKNMKL